MYMLFKCMHFLFDTAKLPHEFFQGYSCAPKFGGFFLF